jgi:hypothetical protein
MREDDLMAAFLMPINLYYGNVLLLIEFISQAKANLTSSGVLMNKISNRLLMSLVIVSSAFLLKTAHAEQALAPVNYPDQFIIQLPDVDRDTLIERVEILRGQLIQRRQALELMVAEKKLDSSDVIITVLMPGGLLYAGYKKVRYQQAVDELAHVNADIEEFSSDLLAMQYSSTPVFVAQVP